MSWFSVPLPNPFKALQFSDDENENEAENDSVSSPTNGVKEDLSAIGESIGRQWRGVASFLAPPPTASPEDSSGPSEKLAGIRSDLAEIGDSFKASLSLLSSGRAVSEFSKLASNFLQLNEEDEDGDDDRRNNDKGDGDNDDHDDDEDEYEGAGITDDVIEFADKISKRPEVWNDFPSSFDQEFDMSDAQSEHASIIEQLVPSLADLRSRLSGGEMSEKQFWMIYFILLLPRLNEDDLELLSTPEIVNARESLLGMRRSKNDTEINSENPQIDGSSNVDNEVNDREMEKCRSLEKATVSENSAASVSTESNKSDPKLVKEERENTDSWLEEGESITIEDDVSSAPNRSQSEDNVSFSDLEDDDTELSNKPGQSRRDSSAEESNEWVQLNKSAGTGGSHSRAQSSSRDRESEGEESNDWLTIDDFDP